MKIYNNYKCGFTLAEVLITLGIIGVIAALTIPGLISNHKKKVVITRMKKFYTTFNQAIKLAEAENGETENWEEVSKTNADSMYNMWNKYMAKHFVSKDVVKTADGIYVKSTDGSGFMIYQPGEQPRAGLTSAHVIFCVNTKACDEYLKKNNNKVYFYNLDGKTTFLFRYSNKLLRTYATNDDDRFNRDLFMNGTNSSLSTEYGCAKSKKTYCAALIEADGWEIAKDYPVRF